MAAFDSYIVAVTTTATSLVSGLKGRYQIVLQVADGGPVTLGQSGIVGNPPNALQFPIVATDSSSGPLVLDVNLDSTDELYAATVTGTGHVQVMVSPR
jgi:hypothetical protein